MSEKKQLGFVKRIMNSLKGGDESKLTRFHKRVIKNINDQIRIRETLMEDLREVLSDMKEDYADSMLSVDFNAISTTDGAKHHASIYINNLNSKKEKMDATLEEIETTALEVERLEELKEEIGKA